MLYIVLKMVSLLGKESVMNKLIEQVKQWHYDRNLIDGSTDLAQFSKLMEETLELHESMVREVSDKYNYYGNGTLRQPNGYEDRKKDDIGDIMVVLINIAERNGLTLEQCLEHAYNDIKDRKGKMVDGVFVKEV
jgi:NTP pyrophosphatase (non-canonical NTP hydrolase)